MSRVLGDLLVIVPYFMAGSLLPSHPLAGITLFLLVLIASSTPMSRKPSLYRHRPMPRGYRRDHR